MQTNQTKERIAHNNDKLRDIIIMCLKWIKLGCLMALKHLLTQGILATGRRSQLFSHVNKFENHSPQKKRRIGYATVDFYRVYSTSPFINIISEGF